MAGFKKIWLVMIWMIGSVEYKLVQCDGIYTTLNPEEVSTENYLKNEDEEQENGAIDMPLILAELSLLSAKGRKIAINGNIPPDSKGFTVTIQTGYNPPVQGQFRLKVNFTADEAVIQLEYFEGSWIIYSQSNGLLEPNTDFNLLIVCLNRKFEIYFNQTLYDWFNHILPYQEATHLSISGQLSIANITGTGENIRVEDYHPTPYVPFVTGLAKPLAPGARTIIRGVIPLYSVGFAITLQSGSEYEPDQAYLRLLVDFSDSNKSRISLRYKDGNWKGEQIEYPVLEAGHAFEIVITCRSNRFQLSINGENFAEYAHRLPIKNATHLSVLGMVNITEVAGISQLPKVTFLPEPKVSQFELSLKEQLQPGKKLKFWTDIADIAKRKSLWFYLSDSDDGTLPLVMWISLPGNGAYFLEMSTFDNGKYANHIRFDKPIWLKPNQPLQFEVHCFETLFKVIFYGLWSYDFEYRMPLDIATNAHFEFYGWPYYAIDGIDVDYT